MFAEFGHLFAVLSLVCAVYAMLGSIVGLLRRDSLMILSGQRAAIAVTIFLTLAVVALESALLGSDFRFKYVAGFTSQALPGFFKAAALWAGQEGSLMFWAWILSLYTILVVANFRKIQADLMPYIISVLMGIMIFFLSLIVFVGSPFQMLSVPAADGHGLNPLLQHWAMAIHPPILYLGYVGLAVPFAFALGALLRGKADNSWVRNVRRWTIVPWFFLGIGMLLGGKWAYHELGWGGYWAWDPVENAAFMPWLTATAFLHSIIIQEKKSMLKIWNVVLIFLTFTLSVFGTFLTRSGVISSVHSFTQSSIGPLFLGFVGFILIFSMTILYFKSHLLRSEARIESVVSRESSFLINNVVFVGACFAVFWGTVFPVVSEAVRGVKITVGPPFFNAVNVPIFLFLLFLTGVGPLVAWRKSSLQHLRKIFLKPLAVGIVCFALAFLVGVRHFYALLSFALSGFVVTTIASEFHRGARARMRTQGEMYFRAMLSLLQRNKRRYGGYIVHFAIVLLFIGVTGMAFDNEQDLTLKQGESAKVGRYEIEYNGYKVDRNQHRENLSTSLILKMRGKRVREVHPQRHFYFAQQQPTTEVAVYSTFIEDFYIVLVGIDDKTEAASFKVYIKPLVIWVWIGGLVLTIGTLISLLPNVQDRKPRTSRASRPSRKSPEMAKN